MTHQEYWAEIASIIEAVREELESIGADSDDHEEINTAIHEIVDGHPFIIYYHQAKHVMVHTDNLEAIEDVGLDGFDDINKLIATTAFFAMVADIHETMNR
tara:strand:- start:1723 stop:2025 length:303 start_codon:yes stop_codon:yes gene_type:complete